MLEVKNIGYSIGSHQILHDVSATFEPGKLTFIVGPNGSGKSTLLKIISQDIEKYTGNVYYDKNQLNKQDKKRVSKIRAVLSQESELSFPLTVEEVVMMGRYPHFDFKPGINDHEICNQALQLLKMDSFKERNYLTLSGGEKQRVHFARTLAQIWEQPPNSCRYLFLDEPIASLDLNYQHEFLRISKEMASQNTVVIAVIHDINLALQYADSVIMLLKGGKLAEGVPGTVITEDALFKLYGLNCRILRDTGSKFPHLVVDTINK